jgi:hypothetical protein
MKNKFYLFLVLCTLCLWAIEYVLSDGDQYLTRMITISGTAILASIIGISYAIAARNANNENPHRFVNGVMAGTMIKFFLCNLAVAALLFLTKQKLHKPDLYWLMLVYVIYSVLETTMLFRISKKKREG